jgi:hypothetical protein
MRTNERERGLKDGVAGGACRLRGRGQVQLLTSTRGFFGDYAAVQWRNRVSRADSSWRSWRLLREINL